MYKKSLKYMLLESNLPWHWKKAPKPWSSFSFSARNLVNAAIFDYILKGRVKQSQFALRPGVNGEMHFYIGRRKDIEFGGISALMPIIRMRKGRKWKIIPVCSEKYSIRTGTCGERTISFPKPTPYQSVTYHKFQEEVPKGWSSLWHRWRISFPLCRRPPTLDTILIIPIKDKTWRPKFKDRGETGGREVKKEAMAIARFFLEAISVIASAFKYTFQSGAGRGREEKKMNNLSSSGLTRSKRNSPGGGRSLNKKSFQTKIRNIYVAPAKLSKRSIIREWMGLFISSTTRISTARQGQWNKT